MPRKRMISPEIWTDPKFVSLSDDTTRLLFIGLFSNANDYGKLRGEWWSVRSMVFPMNELPQEKIESMLEEIEKRDLIGRYKVKDEKYIKLTNWDRHQTVSHPAKDQFPNPSSGNPPEGLRKSSEQVKLSKEKLDKDKLVRQGRDTPEENQKDKNKQKVLDQLIKTYSKKYPEVRKLYGVGGIARARDYFEGLTIRGIKPKEIEQAILNSPCSEPWKIYPLKKGERKTELDRMIEDIGEKKNVTHK